jgi:tripartite-type tricarboxylate transporter receptor subunit TctC
MTLPPRQHLRPPAARAFHVLAALLLALSNESAQAQTPRTTKLIVPYTPGSPSDVMARMLMDEISRAEGQMAVVENRPGGSAAIGSEAVARAAPDGGTLLIATTALIINAHLRKLNYHPLTSFEPICNLTSSPLVLVVNGTSGYHSLGGLLESARVSPGSLTVAGVGPASTVHIAFEVLKRKAGVDMTFVPFPGPPPAVSALLGGHVRSIFVPYPAVQVQLKTGVLRALATSSPTRIEALPDVPTVAEAGYQGYDMDVWFGVVAPAKTPKETTATLARWFNAALSAPGVGSKLVVQGLYPVGTCGADFGAFLRKQYDDYGRAIRNSNMTAE